jgi:hypothetical protein
MNAKSSLVAVAVVLVTVGMTTACRDGYVPTGVVSPSIAQFATTGAPIRPGSSPSLDERQAAEELARAFAAALGSPSFRQEFKNSLAASEVRESKLHLATYLTANSARLAQAVIDGGLPSTDLSRAFARVRNLEVYMPVDQHREKWTGQEEVLVVAAITDGDVPVAYQSDGTRRLLDARMPPTQPVIVLTASESNFAAQSASASAGESPRCNASVATPLAAAARACRGTISPQRSISGSGLKPRLETNGITDAGLYMTFLRVLDNDESWWRGSPEIEVHVTARTGGQTAAQIQCVGEDAGNTGAFQPGIRSQSYVFDMNGGFWDGTVLLLSVAQLNSLAVSSPAGYNVSVWEDDQDSCENHEDEDTSFAEYVAAAQSVSRGINAIRVQDYNVLAASLAEIANFLDGADQMIGLMQYKDSTAYAGTNPGTSHMVFRGTSLNGRATLVYGPDGYVAPSYGPTTSVVVTPETESVLLGSMRQFEATAFDANGLAIPGVTFSWSSSNTGVAPVASDGYVSGNSNGTANITASASGYSGTANVTVSAWPVLERIDGPTEMQPNATCMWEAVVSGGTPPYTYQWTNHGMFAGTEASYTGSKDSGNTSGYIRLEVTVSDAAGGSDSHLIYVYEDAAAAVCFY